MSKDNLIRIMCPNLSCQRVLGVPQTARGKLVRCRNCGMTVRVPEQRGEPSREPAAPAEDAADAAA